MIGLRPPESVEMPAQHLKGHHQYPLAISYTLLRSYSRRGAFHPTQLNFNSLRSIHSSISIISPIWIHCRRLLRVRYFLRTIRSAIIDSFRWCRSHLHFRHGTRMRSLNLLQILIFWTVLHVIQCHVSSTLMKAKGRNFISPSFLKEKNTIAGINGNCTTNPDYFGEYDCYIRSYNRTHRYFGGYAVLKRPILKISVGFTSSFLVFHEVCLIWILPGSRCCPSEASDNSWWVH